MADILSNKCWHLWQKLLFFIFLRACYMIYNSSTLFFNSLRLFTLPPHANTMEKRLCVCEVTHIQMNKPLRRYLWVKGKMWLAICWLSRDKHDTSPCYLNDNEGENHKNGKTNMTEHILLIMRQTLLHV